MGIRDSLHRISRTVRKTGRRRRILATVSALVAGSLSLVLLQTTIASCTHRQEAMLSSQDSLPLPDSLRIAVMPTMSCLPVFYAVRTGVSDSLGLDMKLLRYTAQADIDTAVAYGHADVAWTDLIRAIRLYPQAKPFLATEEEVSLIANKGKRAKSVAQMKEQMVAVTRLSLTDFWCDRMMDSAKMEYDQLFRPQINDVCLRAEMMRTGLLEGAMMCDPYSSWMTMDAGRRLFRSGADNPSLGAWVVRDSVSADTAVVKKLRIFSDMLTLSVEKMNGGLHSDSVRRILIDEYGLTTLVADSIKLAPLVSPTAVKDRDVDTAAEWLRGRGALPSAFKKEDFVKNLK